jgi:hypothetical protein
MHVNSEGLDLEAVELFNKYFEKSESLFSKTLNFEAVVAESKLLEESESVISKKIAFDLHLDMILNEGSHAVTEYYKSLSQGKNLILEKAKKISKNPKLIEESLQTFRKALRKEIFALNENDIAAAAPTTFFPGAAEFQKQFKSAVDKIKTQTPPATNPSIPTSVPDSGEVDRVLAGIPQEKPESSSFGLIKKLWNSLTEGGEPIGILHLVLDIIGVIGDFIIPGVGAIADIINAIIYFIRGKWMLGTISLIAGLLFGAGDALKLLKGSAGAAEKVMVTTAKSGGKEGASELAKVSAKEQGGVIKLLRYIASNIGGVLGKAGSMLGAFFDGFLAKVVGWLPIIGKPLKAFFEKIGSLFGNYSKSLTNFSKEFTTLEKEALEIAAKNADKTMEAFLKSEGEMILDSSTGMVRCVDKSGKQIGEEFSVELLTNSKVLNKKYPNLFKVGEKEAILKYYNSISKSGKLITGSTVEGLQKSLKLSALTAGRLPFFIGKLVWKLITGEDWQKSGATKEEVEYQGTAALQDWLNEKQKKQKGEEGAVYIPAINLNSDDKETFDRITNYQNNYAKLFGQPQVIPVVYDKYGNDELEEELKDFWKVAGIERKKEFEELEKKESEKNKKETNESASFKYIIPFSRFISS